MPMTTPITDVAFDPRSREMTVTREDGDSVTYLCVGQPAFDHFRANGYSEYYWWTYIEKVYRKKEPHA